MEAIRGMKKKKRLFFSFLFFLFCLSPLFSQYSTGEVKYSVIDFYALRYYPFTIKADSIIRKVIDKNDPNSFCSVPAIYKKTAVHLTFNTEFLDNQLRYFTATDNLIHKYLIKPYKTWLQYAEPLKEDGNDTALTIGLYEEYRKDGALLKSANEGIYEFIGIENVGDILDKTFGDIDLFQNKNEAMLLSFKSPLISKNIPKYKYFLSGIKQLNDQPVYEIAFYPENLEDNSALTGYLYVTTDGNYALVKFLFTLNDPYRLNFIKDILFVQTFENKERRSFPLKKEAIFTYGDEITGSLLVKQIVNYANPIDSLTNSEKQIDNIVKSAAQTRAFRNLQTGLHFLLTDYLTIGGKKGLFEYGPICRSVSYNEMEGLRLRASGNTTLRLSKKFLLGGYVAYGTKDERLKYRGDVIYSFLPKNKEIWEFPKRLLHITYVQDFNIPGDDLLTTDRDHFLYSFSQSSAHNMSFQKVAAIEYEHELQNRLSFKISGKYLYDRPEGRLNSLKAITRSEVNFSLRYAPRELFIPNRKNRIYFRKDVELNVSHRIGLKGVFGSDYHYQITNFDIYRKFHLPQNTGTVDARLSAGKVWNRVPFPLLFISRGNQSYIFKENDYNLMDYYEFITDNFIAGNVNFQFNWSPFHLFYKSKIKTNFGSRIIYGPLSDNNNPIYHFHLFPSIPDIQMLGNDPYMEMNVGFSNILKILRVEWVHRLTYRKTDACGKKKRVGSLFVTTSFTF
ncbi:MAG: DUF5686 family protein [Dysgonamonadaceae bacterium]|nr:DUF5686 family protein [Dysgonamonadaceae bacterium]